MVAESYLPSEKSKVQGFHDFVFFDSLALASFLSGVVYHEWGGDTLNWLVSPVAALSLAGLAALRLVAKRERPASGAR